MFTAPRLHRQRAGDGYELCTFDGCYKPSEGMGLCIDHCECISCEEYRLVSSHDNLGGPALCILKCGKPNVGFNFCFDHCPCPLCITHRKKRITARHDHERYKKCPECNIVHDI